MIHVCSLARLHATVDETGAKHIVTLLRQTDRVTRPSHIAAENHLVLAVDDIAMPMGGYTVPAQEHVERLIGFVGGWDRAAPMVVHCFAGISRSTAGAYVAACALNPEHALAHWQLSEVLRVLSYQRTAPFINAELVGLSKTHWEAGSALRHPDASTAWVYLGRALLNDQRWALISSPRNCGPSRTSSKLANSVWTSSPRIWRLPPLNASRHSVVTTSTFASVRS